MPCKSTFAYVLKDDVPSSVAYNRHKHREGIQEEGENQTVVFVSLKTAALVPVLALMIIHTASKRHIFLFLLTEQVSCHQQFISLIRNGPGSQVLGVGDTKKECFVWRNLSQFPAANFQTMLICQRDASGKHLFILLAHSGIAFSCQSWTIYLLSVFLCFFISQIETGDKTQPEDRHRLRYGACMLECQSYEYSYISLPIPGEADVNHSLLN